MEAQTKKSAVVAVAATLLVAVGFFLSTVIKNGEINKIHTALNEEKLQTEKHLSEKMASDKELLKLNNTYLALKEEHAGTQTLLDEANKKLESQQGLVANAKSKLNMFASLKKQLDDLLKQKAELDAKNNELLAENQSLRSKQTEMNSSIAFLNEENQKLKDQNALMGSMLTNNILVEAFKGKKDKLTVVARRTGKVQTTFDLPAGMAESLSFTVTSPEGKVYQNGEKNVVTYSMMDVAPGQLTANLENSTFSSEKVKRVKLIFRPNQKLAKGVYTISVLNKGLEVGKMQVRLR